MTLRLDGLVTCGEIDNTHPYSVCGWLKLRGYRTPLTLNLTGDCAPSLKGMRIRFEDQITTGDEQLAEELDLSELAWQQIGPTGHIHIESDPNKPARLFLEWFSQNGHVALELPNPILEPVDEDELDDDEEDIDLNIDPEIPTYEMYARDSDGDDDTEDDPYGLFSSDLIESFDESSEQIDRELFGGDTPLTPPDLELIEELMDGEGIRIFEVFDPPIRVFRSDQLDDSEVEAALKKLLARLAELGISLDVCEHYTPRAAYELLLSEICPNQVTHPELNTKQWVQNFSTSDYCETCEAEFEREVEEFERNRRHEDDEDSN